MVRTHNIKKLVTHERLLEVLDYDPNTGIFTAKCDRGGGIGARAGKPVGGLNNYGYIRIKVDGIRYMAHRLAWFYVHKVWPKYVIDHINHDKTDNRIANLRDVPVTLNMHNLKGASKRNVTGYLGVNYNPRRIPAKRYRAIIAVNGKQRVLGHYPTAEEAHAVYIEAKQQRDQDAFRLQLQMEAERETKEQASG